MVRAYEIDIKTYSRFEGNVGISQSPHPNAFPIEIIWAYWNS